MYRKVISNVEHVAMNFSVLQEICHVTSNNKNITKIATSNKNEN